MKNEVAIKLAMPAALVIFGVLVFLGMKSIAVSIAVNSSEVSSAISSAISATSISPFYVEMKGLDAMKLELEGSYNGSPIVFKSK